MLTIFLLVAVAFISFPGIFRPSHAQTQLTIGRSTCGINVPPITSRVYVPFVGWETFTIFSGRFYPVQGFWDPIFHTCRLASDYTVSQSTLLIIPSGTTLKTGDHTLYNHGAIQNDGIIRIGNQLNLLGHASFSNEGTLGNYGTIWNDREFVNNNLTAQCMPPCYTNAPLLAGTINNYGTINNFQTGWTINDGGTINNYANITNWQPPANYGYTPPGQPGAPTTLPINPSPQPGAAGGSFYNLDNGTINNRGEGDFENYGILYNYQSGRINNVEGTFQNDGPFGFICNCFDSGAGGLIYNFYGIIDDNYGTILNWDSTVVNHPGGTFNMALGDFASQYSTLDDVANGNITNYGTFNNNYQHDPNTNEPGIIQIDGSSIFANECGGTIVAFSNYTQISCTRTTTTQTTTTSSAASATTSISSSTTTTTEKSTSTGLASTATTTTETTSTPVCDSSTIPSCTSSTTVQGGSATADQSSVTGIYVQITGSSAPDGTSVTITSTDLNKNPSGTTNVMLAGGSFYDVQVSQIPSLGSGAFATVCVSNSRVTGATSLMKYWNGTSWVDAYDVSTSEDVICGTMPVSVLSGTPIVIGSPVSGPPPAMVDGNVTIYSPTGTKGEILFTANATIYETHSTPFTESAIAQYGTLPNGTYGYLGYYQGTFAAVSGGQEGAKVSITVTYDGVSETGYALSPGTGNTTTVNFVFNSTQSGNATLQSISPFAGISALFIPAISFMIAAGKFKETFSRLTLNRKIRLGS